MSHGGLVDQTRLSNAKWTCRDISAHVCVSLRVYVLLRGCLELAYLPSHGKIASILTVRYEMSPEASLSAKPFV